TTSRRGGVATDTGPGPALYDTGPSAGDFAATRANADPDLADSDVFPRVRADIPETEAKTEVKGRTKNAAKGRVGQALRRAVLGRTIRRQPPRDHGPRRAPQPPSPGGEAGPVRCPAA